MRTQPLPDKKAIAETAEKIFGAMVPSWTLDQLLCHPADAMRLCEHVRKRLTRSQLSDYQILQTFLNARKRGRTKNRQRSKAAPRPR